MMILVTGGAGFIGSHTCVELLAAGYEVAVIDNLSNSKAAALDRVEQIAGKPVRFYHADILDRSALDRSGSRFATITTTYPAPSPCSAQWRRTA